MKNSKLYYMQNKRTVRLIFVVCFLQLLQIPLFAADALLFEKGKVTNIYVDNREKPVVLTAVSLLQQDVSTVFEAKLQIINHFSDNVQIVAGTIGQNAEIDRLISENKIDGAAIAGQWETFAIVPILERKKNLLVIVGNDPRGTAYGLLELSRMTGVSPWHYFADVHPDKAESFRFQQTKIQQAPAVR